MPDLGLAVTLPRPVGFPPGWRHRQVRLPDAVGVDAVAGAADFGPRTDRTDPGGPTGDELTAAVVRVWCGEDHGQLDTVLAPAADLAARGEPVLRLGDLTLHDPALLDEPGCPLVRVDDTTPLWWARGTRCRAGHDPEPGWVPFGQAVVRWLDARPGQVVAHVMNMAGLGAGADKATARARACDDLVAQDAAIRWWYLGGDLGAVDVPSALRAAWGDSSIELRLRTLPGATAVLAVVIDHRRGLAALAPAAGPDAPERAAAAALWQLSCAVDLDDPAGDLHRAGVPGLLPHRRDRAYLLHAGPRGRRAVDPLGAVQLGLDPVAVDSVIRRTADTAVTVPAEAGTLTDLWTVDLTTGAAPAGWTCVRALAPGMARIGVPAFRPDLGGLRLTELLPYPGW